MGILVPRMSTAERGSIASPAAGLVVYDVDEDCLFIYRGTSGWSSLDPAPVGLITLWFGDRSSFDNTGLGQGEMKGWAICNGQNNTVDLSGQFIAGYESSMPDYSSVGSSALGQRSIGLQAIHLPAHTHAFSDPGHSHSGWVDGSTNHIHSGVNVPGGGLSPHTGVGIPIASLAYTSQTTRDTIQSSSGQLQGTIASTSAGISLQMAGGGNVHENRPPYMTVFYIQKL